MMMIELNIYNNTLGRLWESETLETLLALLFGEVFALTGETFGMTNGFEISEDKTKNCWLAILKGWMFINWVIVVV